jgi:PilZ domain-containing protein
MSTRREPRVAQNMRVWVTGRDSRGHEFRQTAKLTDASWLGGCLAEIRCLHAPGQVLEVRHRGKTQKFSVVWIDEVSGLAGIRSLNPAESIFGVASGPPAAGIPVLRKHSPDLPAQTLLPTPVPPTRRHKRHHCEGGAEVRTGAMDQSLQRVWATLDDLSLGGCHIKTLQPLPVNTSVEVRLGIGGAELRAGGIVCSSRPGIGMGVTFVDLDSESRARLEQLAERLERENTERSLLRSRTQSA